MNEQERTLAVNKVIASIAQIDDPTSLDAESDVYRDLGVKSVNALDLLLSLEEAFDIQISDEDFGAARTVGSLGQLVANLTSAS